MSKTQATQTFVPKVTDAAGVVSWIHIGDLHMTRAGEQNDLDLEAIVNEINTAFADACANIECEVEPKSLNGNGKLVFGGIAAMIAVLLTSSSFGGT